MSPPQAFAMEDSVRTTSSGTSLYLLSMTSVANAHRAQISRPRLKGYKTRGLCICGNRQGWLSLHSDRQDLVTFSHMAQNVPYCFFTLAMTPMAVITFDDRRR